MSNNTSRRVSKELSIKEDDQKEILTFMLSLVVHSNCQVNKKLPWLELISQNMRTQQEQEGKGADNLLTCNYLAIFRLKILMLRAWKRTFLFSVLLGLFKRICIISCCQLLYALYVLVVHNYLYHLFTISRLNN